MNQQKEYLLASLVSQPSPLTAIQKLSCTMNKQRIEANVQRLAHDMLVNMGHKNYFYYKLHDVWLRILLTNPHQLS
jgi:hypothetical protein